MHPIQNAAALDKVRAADMLGQSKAQMLPLYVELNAYGVPLDTPIHRIVEIGRLSDDIRDGRLSHTAIGPAVWLDPNENPLLRVRYRDPVTGLDIGMESMAADL